jgi:hypothetical protein
MERDRMLQLPSRLRLDLPDAPSFTDRSAYPLSCVSSETKSISAQRSAILNPRVKYERLPAPREYTNATNSHQSPPSASCTALGLLLFGFIVTFGSTAIMVMRHRVDDEDEPHRSQGSITSVAIHQVASSTHRAASPL